MPTMLSRFRTHLFAALAVTPSLACDEGPGFAHDDGDVEWRNGNGQGGPVLNTGKIDVSDLTAFDTNGLSLAGAKLLRVEVSGVGGYLLVDAFTVHAVDGTLVGELLGNPIEGLDFLDSRWTFSVNGVVVKGYLTGIETSAAAGLWDPMNTLHLLKLDPDRLLYTFQWYQPDETAVDVCAPDSVAGSRMVIYSDFLVNTKTGDITDRPNTMYFGCISGAVGKAALWGYAPDSPTEPSVSLAAFETATRVVRDDVCGNGQPHTVAGNPVLLRDRLGISDEFPLGYNNYTTESIWEEGGGAKCLRKLRSPNTPLLTAYHCPNHTIPLCPSDSFLNGLFPNDTYGVIWSKTPM
jgi:hypothetical protein